MKAVEEAAPVLGVEGACEALGVPRSSFYRQRWGAPCSHPRRRPKPPRQIPPAERKEVLEALHSPAYADLAPRQAWAALLDAGRYLCSVRSMYRILEERGEVHERRRVRRHPSYAVPRLKAERPKGCSDIGLALAALEHALRKHRLEPPRPQLCTAALSKVNLAQLEACSAVLRKVSSEPFPDQTPNAAHFASRLCEDLLEPQKMRERGAWAKVRAGVGVRVRVRVSGHG